eukprot:5157719-Amphidinium_carterae.1
MAAQKRLELNTPPRNSHTQQPAPPLRQCCSCLPQTSTIRLNVKALAILGDKHKLEKFGPRSHFVGYCLLRATETAP